MEAAFETDINLHIQLINLAVLFWTPKSIVIYLRNHFVKG